MSTPTAAAAPPRENARPSQNLPLKRSPKIQSPARATQSGAVLAKSVAVAALVMLTAVFQSARSAERNTPPNMAQGTPGELDNLRQTPARTMSGDRKSI